MLEGYTDLIYREDDGSLVVVDYKTDDIPPRAVPARAAYYAPQMTAYRQSSRGHGRRDRRQAAVPHRHTHEGR